MLMMRQPYAISESRRKKAIPCCRESHFAMLECDALIYFESTFEDFYYIGTGNFIGDFPQGAIWHVAILWL
jgi:hypothetical protein